METETKESMSVLMLLSTLVALVMAFPAESQTLAIGNSAPRAGTNDSLYVDFNGDGFADLAVSANLEDLGDVKDAGVVHILHGSNAGLSAQESQLWHQDSPGIGGTAQEGDFFGEELNRGDFNGDGFADLAVGVVREDIGDIQDAGAVNILYGSPAGLSADDSQFWHQYSPGVYHRAEVCDFFGEEIGVGDFNGDGFDDLVVGVPLEDLGAVVNAGAVHILYGSATGLTADGNQFWHQSSPGIGDEIARNGLFGEEVVASDFNGDGFDDLAVGSAKGVENAAHAGSVTVMFGSPTGISADGSQIWRQDSPGIEDDVEQGDLFGSDLAAGDFNGDGFADLVVGVQYEDIDDAEDAGAVNVLYGSPTGLSASGNQFWHQNSPGIQGVAEEGDRFSRCGLTVGDFDGDGFDDLAVGVPHEDVGLLVDVGIVHILYGSPAGLSADDNQIWHQDSPGIEDEIGKEEMFGWELAAVDFNSDGFADLAVGVPGESIGAARKAGAMNVLYGSPAGLSANGNQFWHQDSPGIQDEAESFDAFGIL